MAKYIFTRGSFRQLDDDELMHWKYLKKKKLPNGKWRYYYDLDSLKKDVKSAFSSVTKKTSKMVDSGKKTIAKTIKTTANKISSDVRDIITKAKKNTHKYIAKVPTDSGTYRYFYSDEAYQAYLKGKNAVDKTLNKKLNQTASDTAKANANAFVANTLFGSFGQAVYNVVAPAFAAIQVALTTPKSFSELKKIDKEQTDDEHQKAINPDYEYGTKYDYSMNCSFCTAAYDLRKRGYDVEANPISLSEAYTIEDICTWYKGAESVSRSQVASNYKIHSESIGETINPTDMLKYELARHGDGARGHLALYWSNGGGHDVIWEVKNGEVMIRDCQTGNVSRTFSELSYASDYAYVRTDNLEPTEEVLRTVRNRKKG